jgi:uncharacterized protein DUF6064
MDLPFTVEQFFHVFERYNHAVWPAQVLLTALAILSFGLAWRPTPWTGRAVSAVVALLWAWMAVAYHFAFFTDINPAAWLFGTLFLVEAAWVGWTGAVRGRLRFRWRRDSWGWAGAALVLFALIVYPLLGDLLGHRYPGAPTFGLPCPTTLFTLGMLLLAGPRAPRSVFVVPLLWAVVGSTAAFSLGVYEDMSLLVAGLVVLAAFLTGRRSGSGLVGAGQGR